MKYKANKTNDILKKYVKKTLSFVNFLYFYELEKFLIVLRIFVECQWVVCGFNVCPKVENNEDSYEEEF